MLIAKKSSFIPTNNLLGLTELIFTAWRYYDTNATKFAKHVDTMESRYALESVRNVRTDFSNVVYKVEYIQLRLRIALFEPNSTYHSQVIQQNRAFYHYHQGIHRSSAEMHSEQVFEKEETNLDLNLENVKKKLGKIGKYSQIIRIFLFRHFYFRHSTPRA